jgi:formylglycine-generating enzyme required for sulfatase activity
MKHQQRERSFWTTEFYKPTNRYIAVADIEHTGFTTQYSDAYPNAKVYGPEGSAKKLGINVHEWTADKNHNPMEYDDQVLKNEIKAEYFDGFINRVRLILSLTTITPFV